MILHRLAPERRALLVQILRYAVTGLAVTALGIGVYLLCAYPLGLAPLLANVAAYLVSMGVGRVAHSRFSFKGHGSRDDAAAISWRFFLVSVVSFLLNSFWVWLLTGLLRQPDWTPTPLMLVATPAVVFVLNRQWVFR
jgi:putative flippase GtrA